MTNEMTKEEIYRQILPEAKALVEASDDMIANMANLSALIHRALGFWWTGFYRVDGDKLVLGPFQGPVACTRIGFGKGVCGTSWKEERTVVVPDVEEFPGHIACSSASRSEIVVPVWQRGRIIAVLDIDSAELNTFDETDAHYLEDICTVLACGISPSLAEHVRTKVIPRYASFDPGHRKDHAEYVISQALKLCCRYDVDPEMVFTAAAYHDTGLCEDRKTHHIVSARIIREDSDLRKWFSDEQIETIAEAAEDHRASSDHEPRTIYGKLIAEADRQIIPETVIQRTVQFGFAHYPELDKEGHWQRTREHLIEKYGDGGYLKLWIPESDNAVSLAVLRKVIRDEQALRRVFEKYYAISK